ncbi:MAG: LuxR C-terminal-related transcriptional regulator [Chloroflexota bacterium]
MDGNLQPGGKLALISAPAGSGKTTLVAAWLQELVRAERAGSRPLPIYPPCWLSLDEGDNDLARFLVYLVAALDRAAPGVGEGALSLLRGPQPPPVESFMTTLINDLSTLTEEDNVERWLLLTLDDYHVINNQAIHDALAFLLDHLPGEMRLILISRTEPPLPLARYRGRGQLLALDGNDLRFTTDEARWFLNRVMGLELSQDETAALAARTEGWIAGLQMAALALGAGRPTEPASDQLAGSRLIMDYLLQEVLQSQPAELQAFLLQTSILDRLSGALCDAVTGRDNSQAILAELERRNLFLFALDQEGRWYRYHHLFAELLRQQLAQRQPEMLPELHCRAGIWQQANGFTAQAIQHLLASGEVDKAADLIEEAADPALMRGQFLTVLGWLRLLPEATVRARPRLGVYQAFLMLLDSQSLVKAKEILRAAEEAANAGLAADPVAPMTAETMLIRAILAIFKGDLPTSAQLSQQAIALLPEDTPFLTSLALRNLASVYSMTGEVAAAGEALGSAVSLAERMGDKANLVLSLYALARVCIQQGRLHAAHDYLSRALTVGRDRRGRPLPIVARVLNSLADINREWNNLNEASCLAQDGIELTKQALAFWSIGSYVVLSQVRQAEGDVAAAQVALDAAREVAIRFDVTDLDDQTVELYQARLWLAQGDVAAATRWAAKIQDDSLDVDVRPRRPGQVGGWYVIHEMEKAHLARLWLAQGRPEEARRLLERLRPAAVEHRRNGSIITIDLLLAQAWYRSGDADRALTSLAAALAMAEPEGYVRIFLDEGPVMAELLKLVPADSPIAGYAGRLLGALAPAESQAPVAGAADELLSAREMDVLRLLPTHLNSTEIAAELSISPNTARFHIKNIYSKLGVHNRADAVAEAQQLGLI